MKSKLSHALLCSPWFLLVFLVVPLFVILNVIFHLQLPLVGTKPLLYNNACFAALAGIRLVAYLARVPKRIRYGKACGRPRHDDEVAPGSSAVRQRFAAAGFTFLPDGSYGERSDLGYLGTVLLYAGMFLLLSFGTWDNLCQFSGTLLDSMGPPTKLNRLESYPILRTGPLTDIKNLPQMQVAQQIPPGKEYPQGATDMMLASEDGKILRQVVTPEKPFRYGAYDVIMARLIFEPQIVVRTSNGITLFDSLVKLNPLATKVDGFGFYGPLEGRGVKGEAYYQPETRKLKVVLNSGGKKVLDTELRFQTDQQVAQGDYLLSCVKLGQWTEIHVVRRRHMNLIVAGAVLAAIGALLRLALRPQRVWVSESAAGSCVAVRGKAAKDILQGLISESRPA